jgi:hypothetical protein
MLEQVSSVGARLSLPVQMLALSEGLLMAERDGWTARRALELMTSTPARREAASRGRRLGTGSAGNDRRPSASRDDRRTLAPAQRARATRWLGRGLDKLRV